jgi:hypothetical protein
MAKNKAATLRLIPEEKLEPLKPEVARLADEQNYAFPALGELPFYRAIIYYMMFEYFRDELRGRLGGIDDDTALANAFFWYSVVFEYSHGVGVAMSPLAEEKTMDSIEGAPSHYFTEEVYLALIEASQRYVAAHPLTRAEKSAARTVLSRCQ